VRAGRGESVWGFSAIDLGHQGPDPDMGLRDAIQRIALEFPSYGWRRMTAELQWKGRDVNHKREYRWMREDNLLCLQKRKFVVTTDSDRDPPIPIWPVPWY
jgi:putative transposase